MRTLFLAVALLLGAGAIAYATENGPNPPPFRDCCCEEQCVKAIPVRGWLVLANTCEGTLEKIRLRDIPQREIPEL